MSWVASRITTRSEDMAYCLLGLFDVNMLLLYGEGSKAFLRLQQELLKVSNDQSLFSWGLGPELPLIPEDCLELHMDLARGSSWGLTSNFPSFMDYNPPRPNSATFGNGAFAKSPHDFRHCASVRRTSRLTGSIGNPPVITGGEVRLDLPVLRDRTQVNCSVAILHCARSDRGVIAIIFQEWKDHIVARLGAPIGISMHSHIFKDRDLLATRVLSFREPDRGIQSAIHLDPEGGLTRSMYTHDWKSKFDDTRFLPLLSDNSFSSPISKPILDAGRLGRQIVALFQEDNAISSYRSFLPPIAIVFAVAMPVDSTSLKTKVRMRAEFVEDKSKWQRSKLYTTDFTEGRMD